MGEENSGSRKKGFEKGILCQWEITVVPCLRVSPAGELSDWAISVAMAEFGFSLFPNIWDGAKLKDPGREFD